MSSPLLASMALASSSQLEGLRRIMRQNIQQSFGTFASSGISGASLGSGSPSASGYSLAMPASAEGVGQRLDILA